MWGKSPARGLSLELNQPREVSGFCICVYVIPCLLSLVEVSLGHTSKSQVILTLPESMCITSVDAVQHEVVGSVAAESSELVALTLWLIAERAKGSESAYGSLLRSLPVSLH